ncbi:PAS domain S-box protein [Hwanghaeella grinnelliae]|uniref:histidine kinase n=1 Tax=Hwanghaeella grinnelliae TaxID=2500179 RepID=A0A3S2VPS6_9PROT|nr:PAS domain S-box protein [Hwanghaeella grinnelliae]RVU38789.1 PAS domain S-box protein [Hwanghaeella grinnelliae]
MAGPNAVHSALQRLSRFFGGLRNHRAAADRANATAGSQPSLDELTGLFDKLNQSVAIADYRSPTIPLIYVNAAFTELTGYAVEDALGCPCGFMLGENLDQPEWHDFKEKIGQGLPTSAAFQCYRKDGTSFLNNVQASAVTDEDGTPLYLIAFLQDATRLGARATRTDWSEDRISKIVAGANVILYEATAPDLTFSFVSPYAESVLGFPLSEWTKPSFWADHIHPEDRERAVEEHKKAALAGREHEFEYRMISRRGTIVWMRHLTTVDDRRRREENSDQVRGVIVDVTEQKILEDRFRQREHWKSMVLENAPDAILTVGSELRIQSFNAAAEKVFGWPRDEIVGQTINLLVPEEQRNTHTAMAMAYMEKDERIARTMGDWRLLQGRRRDGSLFPIMVRLGHSEIGSQSLVTAIARDMTDVDRRNRELSDLSQQLALQLELAENANKAKTQFLGTMSHELRTPLNAIIGFAELLESETFGPLGAERYRHYAGDIRTSGQHLLSIINEILDLSRIEAGRVDLTIEDVAIDTAVNNAVDAIRPMIQKAGLTVATDLPADLPALTADQRSVHQILLNLLSNAAKFTPIGGFISVSARIADVGSAVDLFVEDNGRGIPAHILPSLGTPFQKASSAHDSSNPGTGLGLAISRGLAEQMDGSLKIESSEGEWTRITVTLPCALQSDRAGPA